MKLKKIASLMLAGVMAVSMLAGCSGKTEEKPGAENPEVTPVTGAAAALNAELDNNKGKLTFSEDSSIENMVKVYFANHQIKASDWDVSNPLTVDDDLSEFIADGIDATFKTTSTTMSGISNDSAEKKATGVVVVEANAKLFNEDAVLNYLGQYLDSIELADVDTTGNRAYNYTGTVSVAKAESKGGDASAWVVAIVLTRDVADK